jgi:hypothetical protein
MLCGISVVFNLLASNFDPLERRVRAVALALSELVGVAETARARVWV